MAFVALATLASCELDTPSVAGRKYDFPGHPGFNQLSGRWKVPEIEKRIFLVCTSQGIPDKIEYQ